MNFENLILCIRGHDIETLIKRHIYYIWVSYYTQDYLFSEYYEIYNKTITRDQVYFKENYIKYTYYTLNDKINDESFNLYCNIMSGRHDIDLYKNFNLKKKKKLSRFCCI